MKKEKEEVQRLRFVKPDPSELSNVMKKQAGLVRYVNVIKRDGRFKSRLVLTQPGKGGMVLADKYAARYAGLQSCKDTDANTTGGRGRMKHLDLKADWIRELAAGFGPAAPSITGDHPVSQQQCYEATTTIDSEQQASAFWS